MTVPFGVAENDLKVRTEHVLVLKRVPSALSFPLNKVNPTTPTYYLIPTEAKENPCYLWAAAAFRHSAGRMDCYDADNAAVPLLNDQDLRSGAVSYRSDASVRWTM